MDHQTVPQAIQGKQSDLLYGVRSEMIGSNVEINSTAHSR
jgi:hypothetical protein